MTHIAWAMFFVGFALGGLVFIPFVTSLMKRVEADIEFSQNWLMRYSENVNKQYNNLENYVDDHFKIIDGYMDRLANICSSIAEDDNKHMHQILELVRQDHNVKGNQIENLKTMFAEHVKLNDERWNLICDYITNQKAKEEDEDDD